MPVKPGLPSGVRGAGADGLNFPLPVRGTPAVGYFNHWANAKVHEKEIATATNKRMKGFIPPFFHDSVPRHDCPRPARRNMTRARAVYDTVASAEGEVRLELQILDIRYALRGIRRSPLFAASVAATIGLGLGVLCSAFTILNAYVLAQIDLPNAQALYKLSWDSADTRNRDFRLADFEAARESDSSVFDLTAGLGTAVMQDGVQLPGLLVTGNYFQVLGARPVMGRALLPSDAVAPGGNAVAVLSEYAWRSRFGADPAIVGKRVPLGRQSFEVVGVIPGAGSFFRGQQSIGFWAPLTMARAFEVADPWTDSNASLSVIGRLRNGVTVSQAQSLVRCLASAAISARIRIRGGTGDDPR